MPPKAKPKAKPSRSTRAAQPAPAHENEAAPASAPNPLAQATVASASLAEESSAPRSPGPRTPLKLEARRVPLPTSEAHADGSLATRIPFSSLPPEVRTDLARCIPSHAPQNAPDIISLIESEIVPLWEGYIPGGENSKFLSEESQRIVANFLLKEAISKINAIKGFGSNEAESETIKTLYDEIVPSIKHLLLVLKISANTNLSQLTKALLMVETYEPPFLQKLMQKLSRNTGTKLPIPTYEDLLAAAGEDESLARLAYFLGNRNDLYICLTRRQLHTLVCDKIRNLALRLEILATQLTAARTESSTVVAATAAPAPPLPAQELTETDVDSLFTRATHDVANLPASAMPDVRVESSTAYMPIDAKIFELTQLEKLLSNDSVSQEVASLLIEAKRQAAAGQSYLPSEDKMKALNLQFTAALTEEEISSRRSLVKSGDSEYVLTEEDIRNAIGKELVDIALSFLHYPERHPHLERSLEEVRQTLSTLISASTAPADGRESSLAAHTPSSQPGKGLPASMVKRFNAGLSDEEAKELALALALSLVTNPAHKQSTSITLTNVPGDGNCFFHAVHDQLQKLRQDGVQPTHAQLRTSAVDYVEAHTDDFQAFIEPVTPAEYIAKMRQEREWADEIAISALALANKLRIVILKPQAGDIGVVVHGPTNTDTIFLWYNNRDHYQSVASIDTIRNSVLVQRLAQEGITIPEALKHTASDATARADRGDSASGALAQDTIPELGDLLQIYARLIDRANLNKEIAIQNTLEAARLAAGIPSSQAYINSLRRAIEATDVLVFTVHTAFKSVYSEERQFNTAIKHATDAIKTASTAIEAFKQVQRTYQRSPRTDALRYSNDALRDADKAFEFYTIMVQLVGSINQKWSDMASIPESVLTAALRASARTLVLTVKSSGDHATVHRALKTIRSSNLDVKAVEDFATTASTNARNLERVAVISENRVRQRALEHNSQLPTAVVSRTLDAAWRLCDQLAERVKVKSIAFNEYYTTETRELASVPHTNIDAAVASIVDVARITELSSGALTDTAMAMHDVVQGLILRALADPNPGYDVRAVIRNTVHEFMAMELDADGQVIDDAILAIVHTPNIQTLMPWIVGKVAELDQRVEQATLESGISRDTDEFTDQPTAGGSTETLEQRGRDAILARTASILGVPTHIARELANFDHKPTRAPIEIPDDFGIREAIDGVRTAEANIIRALELRADAEHKDSRSAARYNIEARKRVAAKYDLDAAYATLRDASTGEQSDLRAAVSVVLDNEEAAEAAHKKELTSQDVLVSAKTDLIKSDQAVGQTLDDSLLAVERAVTVLSPTQNPKSYAEAIRIAFSVAVTALGEASKAGNILHSRHLIRVREIISQINSQDPTQIAYPAVALAASNPTIADACREAHLTALPDQSLSPILHDLNHRTAEARETFEERARSLKQILADGNDAAARQEDTAVATDRTEYFNAYSRNIGFRIAVVLGVDAKSALTIADHIQANNPLYTSVPGQPNIDAALSVRDAAAIAADYAGIAERAAIRSSEAYAELGVEHPLLSTHEAALRHIKETFAYQADIARQTATAALEVFRTSDQVLPRCQILPMRIEDTAITHASGITSSGQNAALAAFATAIRSSAKMVVDALRIQPYHTPIEDFRMLEEGQNSIRANIVADARSAVRFVLSCVKASGSVKAIQDADTVMQTTLALITQAPEIDFPDSALSPMDTAWNLINEFEARIVDASKRVSSAQQHLEHPPLNECVGVGIRAKIAVAEAERSLEQTQIDLRIANAAAFLAVPIGVEDANLARSLVANPDQHIFDTGKYTREAHDYASSLASLLHSTELSVTSIPLVAMVLHSPVTIRLPREGFVQLLRDFPTVYDILVRHSQNVRYITENADLVVVLPSGVHAELVGQVPSNSEGFRLLTEISGGDMGRRGRGAQRSAPPTPNRDNGIEMSDVAPGGEAAAPAPAIPALNDATGALILYTPPAAPPSVILLPPPPVAPVPPAQASTDGVAPTPPPALGDAQQGAAPAPAQPGAQDGDSGATPAPTDSKATRLAHKVGSALTTLTHNLPEVVKSLMGNRLIIGDFIVNSLDPIAPAIAGNTTKLLFAICGKGTMCGDIAYANETISTPTFVANSYPQLNRTVTVNTGWNALFAGAVALTPYTPGAKAGQIVRFFITDTYLENAPGGLTPALIGPFVISTIKALVSYWSYGTASVSLSSFTQPAAFAVILLNRDELSKYNATEHGFMPYAAAWGAGLATLFTAGPIAAMQTTNVVLKATAIAAVKINGATQCGTIFDLCTSVGLCNTCDTYMALTADREAFIQSSYGRIIKPKRNPHYDSVFASSASEVCSRTTSPANEDYSWVESGMSHLVNIVGGMYSLHSYYFNPTQYIDSVCSIDNRNDVEVIRSFFTPQPVMDWVVNPALSPAGVFVGTSVGVASIYAFSILVATIATPIAAVAGGLAWQGVNHYFPEEVEATTNFISTTISSGIQIATQGVTYVSHRTSIAVESMKATWEAKAPKELQTAVSDTYEYLSNHKLEIAAGVTSAAFTIATSGAIVGMIAAAGAISLASQFKTLWSSSDPLSDIRAGALGLAATAVFPHARPALAVVASVTSIAEGLVVASIRKGNCGLGRFIAEFDVTNGLISNTCTELGDIRAPYVKTMTAKADNGGLAEAFSPALTDARTLEIMTDRCITKQQAQSKMAPAVRWRLSEGNCDTAVRARFDKAKKKNLTNTQLVVSSFSVNGDYLRLEGNYLDPVKDFWNVLYIRGLRANCTVKLIAHSSKWALGAKLYDKYDACVHEPNNCAALACKVNALDQAIAGGILKVSDECRQALVDSFNAEKSDGLNKVLRGIILNAVSSNTTLNKDKFDQWTSLPTKCPPYSPNGFVESRALPLLVSKGKYESVQDERGNGTWCVTTKDGSITHNATLNCTLGKCSPVAIDKPGDFNCTSLQSNPSLNHIAHSLIGMVIDASSDDSGN